MILKELPSSKFKLGSFETGAVHTTYLRFIFRTFVFEVRSLFDSRLSTVYVCGTGIDVAIEFVFFYFERQFFTACSACV